MEIESSANHSSFMSFKQNNVGGNSFHSDDLQLTMDENNGTSVWSSKLDNGINKVTNNIDGLIIENKNSSRPVHAEVCVSEFNCEGFSLIESHVVEFLRHLGPRHVPTVLIHSDFNVLSKEIVVNKTLDVLNNCVTSISLMLDEADGADGDDAGRSVDLCTSPLLVHVYQLVNGEEALPVHEVIKFGSESMNGGTTWLLPSAQMHGLWESLIFDSDIKLNLLQYAQTALLFADKEVSPLVITWNRVILLYGPPGTGKTSLCRALANKLAIRMSDRYKSTQLIEINTMNLMSKWFSESARLVARMFDIIKEYLESHDHLVFLLVDEVESLTAIRSSSMSGCEPSDAIRVVNAVLTQIDQIKRYPNVLILATSNVTGVIDPAFLDRADIRVHIGPPSAPAIYSIYRSCLNELIRVGLLHSNDVRLLSFQSLAGMQFTENKVNSLSLALYRLSERSVGFNGRTLRKLPLLAYAFYLSKVVPNVRYNPYIHCRLHTPDLQSLNSSSIELKSANTDGFSLDNSISLQVFLDALQMSIEGQFEDMKSLELASSVKGRLC